MEADSDSLKEREELSLATKRPRDQVRESEGSPSEDSEDETLSVAFAKKKQKRPRFRGEIHRKLKCPPAKVACSEFSLALHRNSIFKHSCLQFPAASARRGERI